MAIATSSVTTSNPGFESLDSVKVKDDICANASNSGSGARGQWIDCAFPGTSYVSTILFTTASSQNAYYDVTLYYTGGSAVVHSNISTGVGDYNKNMGKYYKVTKVRVAVSSTSTGNTPCIDYVALNGVATLDYSYTISNLVNNNGTLTGTVNLNYGNFVIPSNASQSLTINYGGKTKTITRSSNSSTWSFSIDVSDCTNYVTSVTSTVVVDGISKTGTHSVTIDAIAPTISFPSATYDVQHYEGETVTLFTGSDATDKSLDYEYKVYVDNQIYTHQSNVKGNTLKLPYFDNMPESYQLKVEVRAKQSSDTANGVGKDIWSSWYTSPTITIKSPVIFVPNFTNIKWYQDVEQRAITSPFTEFETKHYCNGEYYTTTQHPIGLTPPLLYSPIKPHLWSYEYYAVTRVKVEGQWSGWYKSPVVEVQFNVQPNDITFSKEIPKYFIEGEIVTIEWDESIDPNSTKTTYTVSLMNNTTEELLEFRGVEEPRLTFTVPKGIISDKVTLGIVAYSDGLYSNPVSSPNLAITDVKVMDCTLDFPRLTTNVLGEFKKLILEINNDRRIEFEDNLDNYLLPLHYFRKGENILTLIATDRNDVEITRSWKVTLDFNLQDLEQVNKIDLKGYVSFNHNESEQYVPCATLFKPNLDLGIVEHELYGSTTFEGADSITQKLVITRDANDDISQLRTLKITGAIE